MLGKLIKHEWKAVGKVLIIMHVALILMAIIGKVMLSIDVLRKAELMWSSLLCLYVLSVIAVGVGTHIYLAMRFYKNMYTDEGYLSFTLPVKAWEHIFSKTLISLIWILVDAVVISVSIIILVMYKGMGTDFLQVWNELVAVLTGNGMVVTWRAIQMVITVILSLVSTSLTYYFSISIGQLFNSHKMLAAVVVYFITVNALQVISTVSSAAYLMVIRDKVIETETFRETFSMFGGMLNIGMMEQIIVVVGFWLITNFIMNKKLNLE